MNKPSEEKEAFEAMLINEQLRENTIEEKLAEFSLTIEMAATVREFQDTHNLRLLPAYLRLRGKAKRYYKKYGDYFVF